MSLNERNLALERTCALSDRRLLNLEAYTRQHDQIGFPWLKQRLDCRLVRLEILMHYLRQERREYLDSEGLALLDYLVY